VVERPDDSELLVVLLEYVRQVLRADHACLTESTIQPGPIETLAASGELTHPELWPGPGPLDEGEYGYDGPNAFDVADVIAIYRKDDPATPGITEFLERIGAAYDATIRVFEGGDRLLMLELYYCDPDQPFDDAMVAEAVRLAPMLAAVLARDRLAGELELAELRFRQLVERMPAEVYRVDAEGRGTYSSPQRKEILIQPEDEPWDLDTWAATIHPDDRERVVPGYWAHLRSGEPWEAEYRMYRGNGELAWMLDRSSALRDAGGEIIGAQGVLIDITPAKLAEQALRESEERRREVLEEMLRAEAEARRAIAADLHDDTVQVMTAALFSLDRVLAAEGSDGRTREVLLSSRETIAAAVERVRRMTFELRPPLLESKGLAAAVGELAEEVALECGFGLDLDLRVGRHPLGTEDLVYRTVKEALTNVRKHAGATVVRVSLSEAGGTLCGLISDDGKGFEVERALDRRRMRLHLGLDTMRERLRLVGGMIEIESTPGSGSRIGFSIPLMDE